MGVLDLLFGSCKNTTTFYTLYNKLQEWKRAGVFPYTYNLPSAISFPPDFWDRIIKVQKETLKDGNERAISIYWADGELVVAPINVGSSQSVTTSGNISVKYSVHPTRKGYYRKEVILNSSLYKRVDVYYKNIPKRVEVSYLFNMHTHPQHRDGKGVEYYNFFSAQDVKSLLSSNVAITGLITNKLWILIRTNKTPKRIDNLTDRDINLENLKRLNIGVYCGEFNKKVERVST